MYFSKSPFKVRSSAFTRLGQRQSRSRSNPQTLSARIALRRLHPLRVAAVLILALPTLLVAHADQPVTAEAKPDRIDVSVNGTLFTSYKFATAQKYPWFYPVNGPSSGKSVTTETSEPYPHHHSLFFACDRVNGANFWQDANEKGQIVSQTPKIAESTPTKIIIEDECLWRVPGKDPIMRDSRRITITAPDADTRIIDFAITLEPLVDITIEKTNHSLFSARVAPELAVTAGGTLVNAEGLKSEKGTYGVASAWCDYSGTRDGITEGIAIIQHPENRWYPSKWFTRDYGFFSPTPMYWLENDQLQLPTAELLTLKYRVLVHSGSNNNYRTFFSQAG